MFMEHLCDKEKSLLRQFNQKGTKSIRINESMTFSLNTLEIDIRLLFSWG